MSTIMQHNANTGDAIIEDVRVLVPAGAANG